MKAYEILILCIGGAALIIVLLSLFSIYPGKRRSILLERLIDWNYAHRGLHDASLGIYENTLPAFKRAVDAGFGAELDVQITADNIPVVYHDFDLKRIFGIDKKINELTYDELSAYKIKNTQETIPLFSEVLKIFEKKAPLIIEIKLAGTDPKSCEYIDGLLSSYKGDYCIESFNPIAVKWYRQNRSEVVRGQLSSDFFKEKSEGSFVLKFMIKNLMTNFLTRPDFVAYNHIYANNLALRIYKRLYKGIAVAWTITNQQDHDKAKKFFDLIIFERYLPERP